jgi:LacI family transcriptional regulator
MAAKELDYRIDPIGRALRLRSTASLGLVVPNIVNPFFPALIQAVEAVGRKASWSLLLTEAEDDPVIEREVADLLVARRVDALLISPCDRIRSRRTIERLSHSLRVFQLDRRCTAAVDYVGVDQKGAIVQVLAHLAENGRTRLAFVGVNPSEWTAHLRETAFRRWAKRERPEAPVLLGESTVSWGEKAVELLLVEDPTIDGIICSNDVVAIGVLSGLESMGIPVPAQVSVTGFDNTLSSITRPELTTVSQPVELIAKHAFRLATQSRQSGQIQRIVVAGELIVRRSSQN